MMDKLDKAIKLRSEVELERSNDLLAELVSEFPNNALVNYQYAWSCDVLGLETDAAPYYEKAIQLGLDNTNAKGAYIGLGSTYRVLGEYSKSKIILENGMLRFPEDNAMKMFYAMTLYNVGQHQMAMELLLTCLVNTTNDSELLSYKKAIKFYKDKLDETW